MGADMDTEEVIVDMDTEEVILLMSLKYPLIIIMRKVFIAIHGVIEALWQGLITDITMVGMAAVTLDMSHTANITVLGVISIMDITLHSIFLGPYIEAIISYF